MLVLLDRELLGAELQPVYPLDFVNLVISGKHFLLRSFESL